MSSPNIIPGAASSSSASLNVGSDRRPYLYIGQLSPQINDIALREIFSAAGPVISSKVVPDPRGMHQGGFNYGFVEYADLRSAETALQTLNGRRLYDSEIRVDWATGGSNSGGHKGDSSTPMGSTPANVLGSMIPVVGGGGGDDSPSGHFNVFVGDLSPEINDLMLRQAFHNFPSVSEARVMWDIGSGKSRGYGFVAFRERTDAEQAIATMNGEWLGSRTIRVNWANQRTQNSGSRQQQQQLAGGGTRSMAVAATLGGMGAIGLGASSMPPTAGASSGTPITYEQALASSPPHNTTVYVGNIPPFATQNDLIPLFSQYGYIVEVRMQAERGFAFVKLDTHENAAQAIVNLAGQIACGRPIKCGWGKDRNESAMLGALRQGIQLSGYGNVALPQAMYGMPQYGFATGGFSFPSNATQNGQLPASLDAATLQQMQAAQAQAVHAQVQAQAMQQQVSQQQQQQQTSQQIPQQQVSPQHTFHQNIQGMPPFTGQGS